MNDLIKVNTTDGQLTVSSLEVAKHFRKNHKDTLKIISIILSDTSAQNCANLFYETTYADSYGRSQKCYEMTRDGYSLLAMGFTGKAALEWKIKYIHAFNEMEKHIKAQQKQLSAMETQAKADRAAAMRMNAENRRLKLLLNNPEWKGLSSAALETMGIKAVEQVTGENLGNSLPKTDVTYSATEIGKAFGLSAMRIGSKANKLGLKTEKYGLWVMDKSRYSTKEVKSFRYNKAGVDELAMALGVENYSI